MRPQALSLAPIHLSEATVKVGVIHSDETAAFANQVGSGVAQSGREVALIEVPSGEEAKDLSVANQIWTNLAEIGLARTDALISVGGGAVTDLAGFVAGTWMRGINVVHCPTTLLAMVDASVGGKAAINTNDAKNLVGVFHDPTAVLCDTDTLVTLPDAEFRSGFAEIIKSGLIGDEAILRLIEQAPIDSLIGPTETLGELIQRSIAVKSAVVAKDPHEMAGDGVGRAALNYGHTFGHAIEKHENYGLRHGEAISIGMSFAAALGVAAGVTPRDLATRQAALLTKVGLETKYRDATLDEIFDVARLDKKNRGSRLRFVLLRSPGRLEFLEAPSRELLDQAWRQIQG